MRKYNEAIMQAVRQRMDIEIDDTSKDEEIMTMSKEDIFAEYCKWNGLLGTWYYDLLNVIEDIYGVELMKD